MKKLLSFLIVGGAVLTMLFFLLYPTVSDYINSLSQSRVIAGYLDDVANLGEDDSLAMLEAARAYNQALPFIEDRFDLTEEELEDYHSQLDTGRGVMGILTINKIDVQLPLYHDVDEGVLQVGLGHMPGTSLPIGGTGTHAFVSGHRGLPSSKLLSDLDKMETGDTFVLFILGDTLTYQVDDIATILPDDMNLITIDPEQDYCTLVTCTPYGINTHRLLVRGKRVDNAIAPVLENINAGAKRVDKLLIVGAALAPLTVAAMVISLCVYNKRKPRWLLHRF